MRARSTEYVLPLPLFAALQGVVALYYILLVVGVVVGNVEKLKSTFSLRRYEEKVPKRMLKVLLKTC